MFAPRHSNRRQTKARLHHSSSNDPSVVVFCALGLLSVAALLAHSGLFSSPVLGSSSISQQDQHTQATGRDMAAAAPATAAGLRTVLKAVPGMALSEGAGVQIRRTVGTPGLRNLDPFLMLDELKLPVNQATAGFPDHPHRGFETCTIMLEGQMKHEDSAGNKGVIGPGGVQWMTAGRGLVHSEFPVGLDGRLWGFQLWINLPAAHKMMKPRYQDYQAADIPVVEDAASSSTVRVMAGSHAGTVGPITMVNPGMLLDVVLGPGGSVRLEVPQDYSSFAYVYDGAGEISGTPVSLHHAIVLGPGDHLTAAAAAAGGSPGDTSSSSSSSQGLKFLLMAGAPIKEPIVQQGPFVMNSKEEILQAYMDYSAGRLQDPNDDVWAAS